jgi:hypothetical protein
VKSSKLVYFSVRGGSIQAGSSPRKSPLFLSGLVVVVALLVAVPVALAIGGNTTRAEYVEAVDPICKRNSEANSRILEGVKQQVKRGKLTVAGKRFIRASAALAKAVRQIAAVPQPSADRAKLGRWVRYLKKEKAYLQTIGKLLKSGKKNGAYMRAVELKSNNRKANAAILGFDFHHCRIDQSRFL